MLIAVDHKGMGYLLFKLYLKERKTSNQQSSQSLYLEKKWEFNKSCSTRADYECAFTMHYFKQSSKFTLLNLYTLFSCLFSITLIILNRKLLNICRKEHYNNHTQFTAFVWYFFFLFQCSYNTFFVRCRWTLQEKSFAFFYDLCLTCGSSVLRWRSMNHFTIFWWGCPIVPQGTGTITRGGNWNVRVTFLCNL